MVTGKNKEQFEKWFNKQDFHIQFDRLDFRMQIGVYLAYYDSLGVNIDVLYIFVASSFLWEIKDIKDELGLISDHCGGFESRNEAYKEAFKKADELTNNKN